METDNIIQLLFDKIFNQLTSDGKSLTSEPFDHTKLRTFENKFVHILIKKLTFRSEEVIRAYLTNYIFQQKFLFSKLKNKLDVAICLNTQSDSCKDPSSQSLGLAVINGNLEHTKILYEMHPDPSVMAIASEYGHEEIYFYLRSVVGLEPNISVYNKAVQGPSLKIVSDIKKIIGVTEETVSLAFESNQTDIIMSVLESALEENIRIPPELISYPILNENFDLIEKIDKKIPLKWDCDTLYYSAILSGSCRMLSYVEKFLPHIHKNFVLDMSQIHRGQKSLLLEEMAYVYSGKKYFSHVMNYAVQSKSIEVVKYLKTIGYGITLSNIINAIQHSTISILDYVLSYYTGDLPWYLLNYFNLNSYVVDKVEKFRVLIHNGFELNSKTTPNLKDYKYDTAHISLILNQKIILSDISDPDYVLKYSSLFDGKDHKSLTRIRMCLELGLDLDLHTISENEQQLIDVTYLFGSISQIKQILCMNKKILPSLQILKETLCWGQIGKLSLVMAELNSSHKIELSQLSQILSDPLIDKFFQINILSFEPEFKFIVGSGKRDKIIKFIQEKNIVVLDPMIIREILLLDDQILVQQLIDLNLLK